MCYGDIVYAPPCPCCHRQRVGSVQIQMHPCKRDEVEPSSPSLTLPYVPSCSSGSPLFPDCLFFKLNYANTSQPSIHGNHISCIPQPCFLAEETHPSDNHKQGQMAGRLPREPQAIGLCQYGPIFSALLCPSVWLGGREWLGTVGKAFSS